MALLAQRSLSRHGARMEARVTGDNEGDPTGGLIGTNVRRLRNRRGWNQERLAQKAELVPELISMIENGRRVGRVATLAAIAQALGEPLAELFRVNSMTVPQTLSAFLESPMAKDVSDAEVSLLREMSVPGRRLTVESYYIALQLIRSTEPAEE